MKVNEQRQVEFTNRFITSAEICDFCNITRPTLTHLRADGIVPPPVQAGSTRVYLWERNEVMPILTKYKAELAERRLRGAATTPSRTVGRYQAEKALSGLK